MRRLASMLALMLLLGGSAAAQQAAPSAPRTPAPVKAAPVPAVAAPKAVLRPDLASDAVRLKATIQHDFAKDIGGQTPDKLFRDGAAQQTNPASALVPFGVAIAAGRDDAAVWLGFAAAAEAAAAAVQGDDARKSMLQSWVLPAAYRSYEVAGAPRDEAFALRLMGATLARREDWRGALDSYRASLAAADSAIVRDTYGKLREEHGFRITGYKVDSDTPSPRICFAVSENLPKSRTDLASFVSLDGSSETAVSAEDRQICVEGLKHGQRYRVEVRKGLPSTVGEDLLKTAGYEIYVRDRAPQVRFVGRTYVLPKVGAAGIPVVSVNAAKVDIKVLRIGDRAIAPTVRSGDFLGQLYGTRFKSLGEDDAATVWSGTLDVEQRLNEEVTTAFPVLDAVGRMQPGIYVMQASPHGDGPGDGAEGQVATQWFVVSDLGLTALSGQDGTTALVRSLATAQPLAGVELRLLARNNEVLAIRTTDAAGTARFDPGLGRGQGGNAPALLVAGTADGDYDLLDLAAAPFDLTDRGVKGRVPPKGLDAFVYAERGVYRSGETVFLTALLRDAAGSAMPGLPLTLVVTRPDGVESRRATLPDAGLGGHTLPLPLLDGAATGTWRVAAYADPKGPAVGETTFLVEDYIPERLSFELKPQTLQLRPGQDARIATATRFLYGAPGQGLEVTGETVVEAAQAPAWPALEGYRAGLTDESVETVTTVLPAPVATDRDGNALIAAPVPAVSAPRPLQARISLRVGEPGGRAIARSTILPILPGTALIGAKPTFGALAAAGSATFDVVTVDPTGRRDARSGLHWSLYRVDDDYQWYSEGGHWNYERVKSTKRVADGALASLRDAPATIAAPVGAGRYRLDVTSDDPALPPTSVSFDVGYTGDNTAPSPDLLDVTLDRADYRPGDTLHATVHARFAGRATLVVGGSGTEALRDVDLAVGDTVIDTPVDKGWGTGAYAIVLAHRPLDVAARRMPGRALGLAPFTVDAASHALGVALDLPAMARPRSTLVVPVKLEGLAPGEEADVTVSAVDLGILKLTRYETPKPNPFFFGQRTLGLDLRDMYGFLIDGLGIQAGAIRSGGDGGESLTDEKPTQAPLARYSGIVKVGADGTATVAFDIPAFNGTVRVSAVAWSKGRAGSAEADVVLRDPVVVTASLPRFLAIGDRARARFDIDDVEGAAGLYRLQVEPKGPWFLPADALDQTVDLEAGRRKGIDVPVTAAGLGTAGLSVRLTGPGGLAVSQEVALGVEPGSPAVYRRDIRNLPSGATLTLSRDLLAEFIPGSGAVSVAVSPLGDIDVPALLLALDRYPVGCSEQIVSRALPLLYLDRLAPPRDLALDVDIPDRIRTAIAQLLSRQTAEGSFGLWTAASGTDDIWLDSYIMDFLIRARDAGYAVPVRGTDATLDRLRNRLANGTEAKDDDALSLSYATYVLARSGRPVIGDLRYLAGSRLDAFATPLSKAQIGAALALLGDRTRAVPVFAAATEALAQETDERGYRSDYGSKLRDAAAVLTLSAEAGLDAAATQAGGILAAAQRSPYPQDTQEQAWLVLAAQAVERQAAGLSLSVNGTPHAGAFYRTVPAPRLDRGPVVIRNDGPAEVKVVVTTSGQLPSQEPAASQGYAIERHYHRLDGREVDPATVGQNDRLAVVLKVTETESKRARLLLTDPLPAGFEIDNPALVEDGAVPNLPGLDSRVVPTHTEFRDDRFTAAFDRSPGDSAFFSVAYLVRAVTPGRFVHAPAVIADMYRPERFGRTGNGVVEVRAAR